MQIQPVTERKVYLDAAKGWGILMVVFGHITALGNPVDTWFSSYKLSIFFIVSGYLLCMRDSFHRYHTKEYLVKQIRSLLLPYFGYSVIVIVYQAFIGLMKAKGTDAILSKVLEQIYATCSGRGISALWFLPALFLGQMLFFLVMKAPRWVKVVCAIWPLVLEWYVEGLLPVLSDSMSGTMYKIVSYPIMTLTKGVVAFWFIGCGYLAYRVLSRVKQVHIRMALGVLLFAGNIFLSQYNRRVDFNLMKTGDVSPLFYVCGIVGSLGTILILQWLEQWWKMTFLAYCGRNSLIIMSTHGTLGFKNLVIAGWKSIATLAEVPGVRYYFECTCILLELMLLEGGVIQIVNNYFPWLAGKYKKK